MAEAIKVRTLKDGWPAGSPLKRGDVFAMDAAEFEANVAAGNCIDASEPWPPAEPAVAESGEEKAE